MDRATREVKRLLRLQSITCGLARRLQKNKSERTNDL